MQKLKTEIILIIILLPILGYIGLQTYNTWIRPVEIPLENLEDFEMDIEESPEDTDNIYKETEIDIREEKTSSKEFKQTKNVKGVLDFSGYSKRDPLQHSLPVKIIPKQKSTAKTDFTKTEQKESSKKELSQKTQDKKEEEKITPPSFMISGIVWGNAPARAIIDSKVYKVGDFIKEAKILKIDNSGIHIIYKEREFCISI